MRRIVIIKNGVVTKCWQTHYLVVAITAMIGIAIIVSVRDQRPETIPPL